MTEKERFEKIEKNYAKIKKLTEKKTEIDLKIRELEEINFSLANYEKIKNREFPFI